MSLVFLNAALLAGAAAAVVPVVIHLLHRQKARQDVLSTIRFLKAGLAAVRRRARLRHILVLILRVTAVLIIVAALARPAYRGALFFRKGTAPVSCVIVLDNSTSMAYVERGRSGFDAATEVARRIALGLPPGSRAALVVTGLGPRGETLDREFTFSSSSLATRVIQTELSACGGTCADALRRAYSMLESENPADAAQGCEVYVLSDLGLNSWQTLSAIETPEDTATFVIDVGSETNENFRIVEATAERRKSPSPRVELEAVVASGKLGASRLVEVYLGGVKRAEKIVEVPAGSRVRERLSIPILEAGDSALQGWVSLREDDPVKADNRFYFTAPAARQVECLVLHNDTDGPLDTGLFVRDALEPAGLKGETDVRVTPLAAGRFRRSDLAGRDCLVLADAGELSPEALAAVEEFVESGGGLVAFVGERTSGGAAERLLSRYLSLEGAEVKTDDEGETMTAFAFEHPALAAFAGGRNGNLAAARFYRRRLLAPQGAADGAAAVLARFEDGSPALAAAPAGSGRIVAAAFSPVRNATDLVLRASFVPFINELVLYAAGVSAGGEGTKRIVGDAVAFEMATAAEATKAVVMTPLGDKPVELSAAPGTTRLDFRAYFPGNYIARIHTPQAVREMPFSVNLDPSESDGERIAPEEIERLIPRCVVAREPTDRRIELARGATRGAREIFDLFVVAALAVLALESYISNRFYREGGQDR